jgi:hypothetical protein
MTCAAPIEASPSKRIERSGFWLTTFTSLLVFVYFFHGVGWNQNASFALMRSLVERRTADISPFAAETGDVSRIGNHLYAAKAPGLALLGAPVYFAISTIERAGGVSLDAPRTAHFNQYLMTILLSGIPASLVAGMICLAFARAGASRRDAMLLAGAFAYGSLLLPYAGVLMDHSIVTAALFGAWLVLTAPGQISAGAGVLAGVLLGIAGLCDYWTGPIGLAYLIYFLARPIRLKRIGWLAIGPLLAVAMLLVFNRFEYGNWLTTAYAHDRAQFRDSRLLLGVFDWPDPKRLYWITFHRMRGLFVSCPVFLILFLSLFAFALKPRWRRIRASTWLALGVIGWFLLFQLTFLGWTGGAAVGPRYMTPALPFVFLWARRGFERFRAIATFFIVLSIVQMLVITTVQPLYPANEQGPPQHYDPLGAALVNFSLGKVAMSPAATNLGLLCGLPARWSVVPPAMVMVGFFALVLMKPVDAPADAARDG